MHIPLPLFVYLGLGAEHTAFLVVERGAFGSLGSVALSTQQLVLTADVDYTLSNLARAPV